MKKLILMLLCTIALNAFSQLRVAKIFTDHAVLQRQKSIPVWGWTNPRETILVSLADHKQTVKADDKGYWIIKLPAMEAGGPFTLTVKGKSNTVTFNDILIGEVWVCSGQSNMEFKVSTAKDYLNVKDAAVNSKIRHFKVENRLSFDPLIDLNGGNWTVCSPTTVGDFTAVGYFFARELAEKLNVPVGLINSSWGGSQIEGWISREGFQKSEVLSNYLNTMPKNWAESELDQDRKAKINLFGTSEINITTADEEKFLLPDYDFSKWRTGYSPGNWDWQGIWAFRGKGYAYTEVDVPENMVGLKTTLGLGKNDSQMKIYLNSKLIWEGTRAGKHQIELPANSWKVGKNKVLLKYGPIKNPEWFGMGLDGSADDLFVKTADGSAFISLAGTKWKLMPSFAEPHTYARLMNNVGLTLYNAMINPIVNYGIRGALWYQGEANTSRAYQYRKAFPEMINDWRTKWGETFPFYFVQLSSYGPNQNSNEGSDWAELREAQTMALSLPQTGMAVTTDIGNANDIHPTNKQDVGKRLAAVALYQTYRLDLPYSGPIYKSMTVEGNKAIVEFDHAENGLVAKEKYAYLMGFEIAGDDKLFYYAQAQISGNTVVVSHPKVQQPVAVRYAWSNAPVDANLFNTEGFPASPFRTDEWTGITLNGKYE